MKSGRALRIVMNAVSAKSGGAATYLKNLAPELGASRHSYVLGVPPALCPDVEAAGGRVSALVTGVAYEAFWRRLLWDQLALRSLVRRKNADVLVSTSDFGMWRSPCKQVLMVRNPLFFSRLYCDRILPRKSRRFRVEFLVKRWLVLLSVRCADLVVTASRAMLEDLRRHVAIPEGKAIVNPFGVPLEKFERSSPREDGRERGWDQADAARRLRLLYVSEYGDYKDLTTLLEAVLLLRRRCIEDFSLVTTAGPEQFPDVESATRERDRALARDPRVAPYVRFTGPLPYEMIDRLYRTSHVFVFPSLAESFGHPLVEAMASGLPIVASDIPIHREICAEAAVYFRPGDAADLVDRLLVLRANGDLRKRLGETGSARARADFDWKAHVRRFVDVLERIASGATDGVHAV